MAYYFILQGCVRKYFIAEEGKEVTVNFFTKAQAVVLFKNFKPNDYFLAYSGESTLIVGML